MRYDKIFSTFVVVCCLVFLFAWLTHNDVLELLAQDSQRLIFNSALTGILFLVAGLALWVDRPRQRYTIFTLAGILLIVVTAVDLSQTVVGLDYGIDRYFIVSPGFDRSPGNFPGRLPAHAAVAFILCGMIFLLLARPRRVFDNALIRLLLYGSIVLAIVGFADTMIHLEWFYQWYQHAQLAVTAALLFFVLALAQWSQWFHQETAPGLSLHRLEQRIRVISLLVVMLVAIVSGVVGFGILASAMQGSLARGLRETYSNRSQQIANEIKLVLDASRLVTNRLVLNDALDAYRRHPDDPHLGAMIARDGETLVGPAVNALEIRTTDGKTLYRAGHFATAAEMTIVLKALPPGESASILWTGRRAVLHAVFPIARDGVPLGTAIVERDLTYLSAQLFEPLFLGQTAEMRICAARSAEEMDCLPSLLSGKILHESRSRFGVRVPMDQALLGQHGQRFGRDYRDAQTINAYGPVGDYGFGLLVKADSAEFYGPIRDRMETTLVVMALLALLGVLIQRLQLLPLVARLAESEREALHSEARLARALRGSHDGIWDWDIATGDIFYSLRFKQLLGYGEDEFPNRYETWEAHLHPDDRDRALAAVKAHLEQSVPYQIEYRLRSKNHGYQWFEASGECERDAAGAPVRMAGCLTDITDRREASERFRVSFDNAAIGMALVSPYGEWLKVNAALCRTFGYSEEELLKTSVQSLTYPDDLEFSSRAMLRLLNRETESYQIEKRYIRRDASIVWMLLNVSMVWNSDGTPRYFVAQIQDISERKAMERIKNEFVSTVSHELRTPLTSIRGSLGLLLAGVGGELAPKARNLVEVAQKNSERLIVIINDILDIEKIESGQMHFDLRPTALAPLVEQAVEQNQAYGEKFRVRFVLQRPLADRQATIDGARFMQVMANLLSNAAKFSPAGQEVAVALEADDRIVRVRVRDHGAGIPLEFQARVFGKFAQADGSDTKRKGGTGLGLNISRALVEQMGGRIGFTTVPGEGTEFFMEFPIVVPLAESESSRAPATSILIVEDDRLIATLLQATLQGEGVVADIALTAADARHMLARKNYLAITLDLVLPDVNGIDFIRELRSDPRTAKLPIIVISAQAEAGRQSLNGNAVGILDWLSKPVDPNRLREAVAGLRVSGRLRILHVEDDRDIAEIIGLALQDIADVIPAPTLAEAYRVLGQGPVDLIILDIGLPDGSGLALLDTVQKPGVPAVPVIIFSATEISQEVSRKVAAALVKSRSSEQNLVQTITALLQHYRKG